jgi:hypothetical protein
METAKTNKGKMLFTYADMKGGDKLAEFLGAAETTMPMVLSMKPANDKK